MVGRRFGNVSGQVGKLFFPFDVLLCFCFIFFFFGFHKKWLLNGERLDKIILNMNEIDQVFFLRDSCEEF